MGRRYSKPRADALGLRVGDTVRLRNGMVMSVNYRTRTGALEGSAVDGIRWLPRCRWLPDGRAVYIEHADGYQHARTTQNVYHHVTAISWPDELRIPTTTYGAGVFTYTDRPLVAPGDEAGYDIAEILPPPPPLKGTYPE